MIRKAKAVGAVPVAMAAAKFSRSPARSRRPRILFGPVSKTRRAPIPKS
jgi:hypothetical protein